MIIKQTTDFLTKCHKLLIEAMSDERWDDLFDECRRFSKKLHQESDINMTSFKLFNPNDFKQNKISDISTIINRFSENDKAVIDSIVFHASQQDDITEEEEKCIVVNDESSDKIRAKALMIEFANKYTQNLAPSLRNAT